MSILDSLFIGVFGIVVVFIVLVGLSLLLRLQSALISWFLQKKPAKAFVPEAADVVTVAASVATDAFFDTPPSIRAPVAEPVTVPEPAPAPALAPVFPSRPAAARNEVVTAPVPGTVIEIMTTVGAKVKRGDLLLLLEAMKMDNGVAATRDGTVTRILTSCGKSVIAGTPLIVIQ